MRSRRRISAADSPNLSRPPLARKTPRRQPDPGAARLPCSSDSVVRLSEVSRTDSGSGAGGDSGASTSSQIPPRASAGAGTCGASGATGTSGAAGAEGSIGRDDLGVSSGGITPALAASGQGRASCHQGAPGGSLTSGAGSLTARAGGAPTGGRGPASGEYPASPG